MAFGETLRSIGTAASVLAAASAVSGCATSGETPNGGHGRGMLSRFFDPEKPELQREGDAILRGPFRVALRNNFTQDQKCVLHVTRTDNQQPAERATTVPAGEKMVIAGTNDAQIHEYLPMPDGIPLKVTYTGSANLVAACQATSITVNLEPVPGQRLTRPIPGRGDIQHPAPPHPGTSADGGATVRGTIKIGSGARGEVKISQ